MTHTGSIGLTQTAYSGVSHTDSEAVEVGKWDKKKRVIPSFVSAYQSLTNKPLLCLSLEQAL